MISQCRVLSLPRIADSRGSLTFIEGRHHVPFDLRRIYYLYDVPDGVSRGAHAHKALHQLFVAVTGSFDVVLDDGQDKKTVRLDRPDLGLYVCPMIWRELSNFSSGSVCMVLASDRYDESDYFRSYDDFLVAKGAK